MSHRSNDLKAFEQFALRWSLKILEHSEFSQKNVPDKTRDSNSLFGINHKFVVALFSLPFDSTSFTC
jgi:hypothetical protein